MLRFRGAIARCIACAACALLLACTSDDDPEQMQQPAAGNAAVGGTFMPGGSAGTSAAGMFTPQAGMGGLNPPPQAGDDGNAGAGGTAGSASGGQGGSAGQGGRAGSAGTAGSGGTMGGSGGMSGGGSGGSAGTMAGSGGSGAVMATFTEVYGIINMKCGGGTTGCHVTGRSGNLQMPNKATARMNLVGVDSQECPGQKRVEAGNADDSVLIQAIEGTACVGRMPRGRTPLTAAEIAKFRAWVDAGAMDD